MTAFLLRFLLNKSAASAIEYGLIVGLIATITIVTLSQVGAHLTGKFSVIASQISTPTADDETGSILDIERSKQPRPHP
jgi:Flp pilus assembly pilin Flp